MTVAVDTPLPGQPRLDVQRPVGFVLSRVTAVRIARAAEAQAPQEMCGVVVAHAGDGVVEFFPITNVHRNPEHFYMFDAREYTDTLARAAKAGKEYLGIVHSHPQGPAALSQEDIERALASDLRYFVLALVDGRADSLTCWRVRGGRAIQEQLVLR